MRVREGWKGTLILRLLVVQTLDVGDEALFLGEEGVFLREDLLPEVLELQALALGLQLAV